MSALVDRRASPSLPPARTPLDAWVAGAVGRDAVGADGLLAWQLARVRETLERARAHSRFYARRLAGLDPSGVRTLPDLARVPLTTADDIRGSGRQMLCVPSGDVERIVTLPTSGTTGAPKRVFFTPEDLEATVDFFAAGMSTFTGYGDRVLVLMPGPRPASIGQLLRHAMPRLGATAEVYGPVGDPDDALGAVARLRPTVIVGIPVQVHTLVRHAAARGTQVAGVRSVLLSADRTPSTVRSVVERAWACDVYDHYGTTEMGYGGGVECEAHDGYHLRAADLLFEVVDPATGRSCRPGEGGEVVVTTLRRTGMPLIRYRTGDVSALLPGPCRCGSRLPRLQAIPGRLDDEVRLPGGGRAGLPELDERLLGLEGVADYTAVLRHAREGPPVLEVVLRLLPPQGRPRLRDDACAGARRAVETMPGVAEPLSSGRLGLTIGVGDSSSWPVSNGMWKRAFRDEQDMEVVDA